VSDPFAPLSDAERALLRRARRPNSVTPMRAFLIDRAFSADGWIFERKLDGIRCVAIRGGKNVRLLSRNALSLNARFPELVDSVGGEPARDFVIDGEVVAFDGSRTSFARLAQRNRLRDPRNPERSAVPVFLYAFDLLYLDGYDTTRVPLRGRKAVLRHALQFGDGVRFTPHRNRDGERYFEEACRRRWEGLIAKRADSSYQSKRTRDWLKIKCENEQELVIGGFTEPRGSRTGFGALLLGYYRNGELVYAGKVGTGFDTETLESLGRTLRRLRRSTSPFAGNDAPTRGTTWVQPKLVAQVAFTEWTRDGRLRHPSFLGLRDDKDPREVVRE
jgi:bifunctional non-homologous end joining protein LigD